LIRKSEEFEWKKHERQETYILFSKAGFSFEPEENVLLIDLKKMISIADKEIQIRALLVTLGRKENYWMSEIY